VFSNTKLGAKPGSKFFKIPDYSLFKEVFSKLPVHKSQNHPTPAQACVWSSTLTIRKMTENLQQYQSTP